ncbi:MAG: hypothetical protein AB7U61_05555 [Methylocystis sp.]
MKADPLFLRRPEAAEYLRSKYGFGTKKSLDKLATVGGGPEFRKAGAFAIYEPDKLDEWALSKISAPMKSTSDTEAA